MSDTDLYDRVLADLKTCRTEAAECRRRIGELEERIGELSVVEKYIRSATGKEAPGVVAAAQNGHPPDSFSFEELLAGTEAHLRRVGRSTPQRPIEIAQAIQPGYDADADERGLENRIYSLMRKRPKQFVRVQKGHWTLAEFGVSPTLEEEEDLMTRTAA